MRSFLKWTGLVLLCLGLGAAGMFLANRLMSRTATTPSPANGQVQTASNGASPAVAPDGTAQQTVKVQPAASVIGRISASGQIALVDTQYVVMNVGGTVQSVRVHVGDQVQSGDALLAIDTTDLERAARRAQINVATAKNSLSQLQEPADANELAQAQAELVAAQRKLVDAQKSATSAEIEAAEASVASGWARYNDLLAPKSAAEITKLEANLRKAEIDLQEKQRAYDKVKWRSDIGMTQESSALQQSTISYEAAKADYEVSTKAASQADIQSALSSAKNAEKQLNDLRAGPDQANIASAQAQVASAQKKLQDLQKGKSSLELEAAQLKLESALIDLQEAGSNLQQAQVKAPIDGTVLSVSVEKGQRVGSGSTVVTLADLHSLQLSVDVAEADVDQLSLGQEAEITIDALRGQAYTGKIERIAPVSNGGSGVVNYNVTLLLTSNELAGVLPDMTAVATVANTKAASGWLVPTTAIQTQNNQRSIQVVRNGQAQAVAVVPGETQGEWTVVQAPQLQAGDEVIGSVTSYINQDEAGGFGPPGGGGPGGGGPGGGGLPGG